MAAKPNTPITREEMYLDVMTGGSSSLPEPITLDEMYLAKIAGMAVDLPAPVPLKHKFLAKIAGMQVNVPTYTTGLPRIYAYLAKAAGQDVEVPQPVTREEMYWFDYVGGQPAPPEREYTGAVPVTFIADGTPLLDYLISGNTVQPGTPTPDNPIMPEGTGERTGNLWNRDVPKYDYVKDYKKYNPDNTIALKAGTYTVSSDAKLPIIQVFDNSHTQLSVSDAIAISSSYFITWDGFALAPSTDAVKSGTIILLSDCILTFAVSGTLGTYIMLNLGSTALPYEPYGYKIPIISAGQTFDVYIGAEPLRKAIDGSDVADTITYSTQQLIRRVDNSGNALVTPTTEAIEVPELPTNNGSNTLDILTTVKPSEVYIKYKGEPVAGSQTSSQSSVYAPVEVSDQSENVDDINSNSLGKEEETE